MKVLVAHLLKCVNKKRNKFISLDLMKLILQRAGFVLFYFTIYKAGTS